MSADNWMSCPKCGEYDELRPTFREDYEIYADDSDVSGAIYVKVVYHGQCILCDCDLKFKHAHEIPV